MLKTESDLIDLLASWVAWFEKRGLLGWYCGCCWQAVDKIGHASDCAYAQSKALLAEKGETDE